MIVKLYKSNQLLVLFALPLIMLVFWGKGLFFIAENSLNLENSSWLMQLITPSNFLLNKIFAFLIILYTGIVLNTTINKNEVFERQTYLPALIYVVFMSSFPNLQQLHPMLVSNLFWVFAFRKLLMIYNQLPCKSEVFDASFLIVVSFLFFSPTGLIILILPWATLFIFRPFILREYSMPLIAGSLVAIYVYSYSLFYPDYIDSFQLENEYTHFEIFQSEYWYPISGVFIFILYLSIVQILGSLAANTLRFKKIISVVVAFLLLSVFGMGFEKFINNNEGFLLLSAVPFTLILSFYFFYAKKAWLAEGLFYLLCILLIVNIYLPS